MYSRIAISSDRIVYSTCPKVLLPLLRVAYTLLMSALTCSPPHMFSDFLVFLSNFGHLVLTSVLVWFVWCMFVSLHLLFCIFFFSFQNTKILVPLTSFHACNLAPISQNTFCWHKSSSVRFHLQTCWFTISCLCPCWKCQHYKLMSLTHFLFSRTAWGNPCIASRWVTAHFLIRILMLFGSVWYRERSVPHRRGGWTVRLLGIFHTLVEYLLSVFHMLSAA